MTAIIHDNIFPLCTYLYSTYADPDHPVENLLTESPADYFLSPEKDNTILWKFDDPVEFDGIGIVAHDFPSQVSLTLVLSNDNFQTNEYVTLEYSKDSISKKVAGINHKHFKIWVHTYDTGFRIGQLYLGTYTEISEDPYYPIQRIPVETSHIINSDIGQKNKVIGVLIWKISLNFPAIPLDEFVSICQIISKNEVIILIVSEETKEAYQGILSQPKGDEELEGVYFTLEFEQNPYEYPQ
ncbi:MAG: hypothetical protein PVH61_13835 [Candidatus Aminicenantes bacterium]|jgi:hypothetical protein